MPSDFAFPPACAICCYCLSVSACGRKPAGIEDSPKHSEESPEKSDQDGDCKWTTGSRRFGTAPMTSDRFCSLNGVLDNMGGTP